MWVVWTRKVRTGSVPRNSAPRMSSTNFRFFSSCACLSISSFPLILSCPGLLPLIFAVVVPLIMLPSNDGFRGWKYACFCCSPEPKVLSFGECGGVSSGDSGGSPNAPPPPNARSKALDNASSTVDKSNFSLFSASWKDGDMSCGFFPLGLKTGVANSELFSSADADAFLLSSKLV